MSGILLASVGSKTVSTDPAIGSSYKGGYYAGKVFQSGAAYYIIVSPKASGQSSSKQWKTSNTSGPTESLSRINGAAASSAMNSSTYPAAQFCEGLSIGGYSDWYLPAVDELEVCYRNLKPTTQSNSVGAGANSNSIPTGDAYTSSVPAQTTVAAFKDGGSEAFTIITGQAIKYLTSTEQSSSFAYSINFFGGSQSDTIKDDANYVRAIRKEAV